MKAIKAVIITTLFSLSLFLIKDSVFPATDMTDIPLESNPCCVAINPFTNQAFILSEKSDALLVVDLNTDTVLSTIPLVKKPTGLALATELNIVLIGSGYDNTLSIIDLS